MIKESVSIYNYIDYVEYLAAWFENQKQTRYGFSYRSFNKRANIKSPNYMQRIISGQRKLSPTYLEGIFTALELTSKEQEYFSILLKISQSKKENEREQLICALVTLRAEECQGKLTQPMLHYLAKWYYPVVRELIVLRQTTDARTISQAISPTVKPKELKQCIDFLLMNEYIEISHGAYRHKTPILTTGDSIISEIVSHFHKENLLLAADELPSIPLEKRDVSSLILSLSESSFQKIKSEIQLFRKKLLHISEEEKTPDRVYHLGFQLLPRSNEPKELS